MNTSEDLSEFTSSEIMEKINDKLKSANERVSEIEYSDRSIINSIEPLSGSEHNDFELNKSIDDNIKENLSSLTTEQFIEEINNALKDITENLDNIEKDHINDISNLDSLNSLLEKQDANKVSPSYKKVKKYSSIRKLFETSDEEQFFDTDNK